jgi:hypothetical protein
VIGACGRQRRHTAYAHVAATYGIGPCRCHPLPIIDIPHFMSHVEIGHEPVRQIGEAESGGTETDER